MRLTGIGKFSRLTLPMLGPILEVEDNVKCKTCGRPEIGSAVKVILPSGKCADCVIRELKGKKYGC